MSGYWYQVGTLPNHFLAAFLLQSSQNEYSISSPKFYKFTSLISSKDCAIAIFFKSKTIKEAWNVKKKHHINKTMQDELASFYHVLQNADKLKWKIPIRDLIDSDYECAVIGDAWISVSGAFCNNFQFWHCIPWSQHIIDRMLKSKEWKHSEKVSSNCIRRIIILISWNAVLDAVENLFFLTSPIPNL